MALIGKHNINNAKIAWPNPFNLEESDMKDKIEGYPIEIITLAMIETILQRSAEHIIEILQEYGIANCFIFADSKDGYRFWDDIKHKQLNVFYETYTPDKLLKRIEEVKPLIPYYKKKK